MTSVDPRITKMSEPQPEGDELPDDLVVEENVPDPEGDKPE